MFGKILNLLSVPIMFLNIGSGIIGGIWLAILGKWSLLGIGLLFSFTSHWLFALLMLPGLPLAALGVYLYEKRNPLRYVISYISQLHTNILIVLTILFAYLVCRSFYTGNVGVGYIPYLLWSWGMALGPWQFFASKEPDNEFSAITLFSASVFYFLFLTSLFISPALVIIVLLVFGFVQLIALPIFNMYLERQMQNY